MEPLAVSQALLWLVVAALAVTVFALARQIGVLHERIAPLGALMTDRAVDVGDPAPALEVSDLAGRHVRVGGRREDDRAQFLLFVSPACPMCKKLLPVARSFARREARDLELVLVGDGGRDEHEALIREHKLDGVPFLLSPVVGMTYGIGKLPYAVLIDHEGILRSKGLVNSREHLESLLTAKELGHASIQDYLTAAEGEIAQRRDLAHAVVPDGRTTG
jgi:methylamine dehydrogenase accessory protein MauD